jgi:hypothetical protein
MARKRIVALAALALVAMPWGSAQAGISALLNPLNCVHALLHPEECPYYDPGARPWQDFEARVWGPGPFYGVYPFRDAFTYGQNAGPGPGMMEGDPEEMGPGPMDFQGPPVGLPPGPPYLPPVPPPTVVIPTPAP